MILRKPYAFLIRYFKIIHIIIAILTIYLAFRTNKIVTFFNDYVANGYFSYSSNLSGTYINFFMYLSAILIILATLTIYLLMKQKKKPTVFYISLIIYYVFLFGLITITYSILRDLETSLVEVKAIRAYRDLSIIFTIPEYFFIIVLIVRGIGFDIKKFNFAKDLQELKISETDNEEYEFALGVETYKIKRTLRRILRESRYYFLENKFIFTIIMVITTLIIISGIYFNTTVFQKVYKTTDTFSVDNMKYTIEDSYLTNLSYNGDKISNKEYFLVINYKVINPNGYIKEIDLTNFRLISEDGYIYPVKTYNEDFVDLGIPYKEQTFLGNSTNQIMMIYAIPKDYIKTRYNLLILESVEFKVGEINSTYRKVSVKPTRTDSIEELGVYNLNDSIELSDSKLGKSTIMFSNITTSDTYRYYYEFCFNNTCTESSNLLNRDYGGSDPKTLYIFDYELSLDETTDYYNSIFNSNNLFDKFIKFRYTSNNVSTTISVKNVTPKYVTNKIVLQASSKAYQAEKLEMLITVRNKQYVIKLK